MISLCMECYLDRVRMGISDVQFPKMKYVGRTCSMVKKYRSLIVIGMQIGDDISASILKCNSMSLFRIRNILGWASPLQVDVSI